MSTNKQRFSVIGCGRLGINLAVFLAGGGFCPAVFCSRSLSSAASAVEAAGAGRVVENPADAAKAADLVFITTPDAVIEPVCTGMADQGGFHSGSIVFHLSGALPSTILSPAKRAGAGIGSIHPLQAFAPYQKGVSSPFQGINMSVEGGTRAVALGRKIVSCLGARSFAIPTRAKVLYHAAAVAASNYLVTLENFALTLMGEAGLSEAKAWEILEPLIQGTLKNIRDRGSVQALTGPVARGDHDIIARHLSDIDRNMPRFSELYRVLGRHTLDIAEQQGEMIEETRDRLTRLFSVHP